MRAVGMVTAQVPARGGRAPDRCVQAAGVWRGGEDQEVFGAGTKGLPRKTRWRASSAVRPFLRAVETVPRMRQKSARAGRLRRSHPLLTGLQARDQIGRLPRPCQADRTVGAPGGSFLAAPPQALRRDRPLYRPLPLLRTFACDILLAPEPSPVGGRRNGGAHSEGFFILSPHANRSRPLGRPGWSLAFPGDTAPLYVIAPSSGSPRGDTQPLRSHGLSRPGRYPRTPKTGESPHQSLTGR